MNFVEKYGANAYSDLLTGQKRRIVKQFIEKAPINAALHGGYGFGKTSTAEAIIKGMNCQSTSGYRPCGVCPACRFVSEALRLSPCVRATVPGGAKFQVFDCTMLTIEHMSKIREDMTLYADAPGIYAFDEFHRTSPAVQMAFLKLLETGLRCSTLFCFASANTDSVTQPLLQRLHLFCLERPSVSEFVPLIRRVSEAENIQIVEPAAPEALANACGRIPRVVLKALEMLAFDGAALSRVNIAELCKRLNKIESGTENAKPKEQCIAVY